MKLFHCDHCQQPVYFENSRCLSCGHALAYLPDLATMASLEAVDANAWRSPLPATRGRQYRLCDNYCRHNVCNWALPAEQAGTLCASCRLTRVIPDLDQAGHKEAWYRLESAKRRLLYGLLALKLPLANKNDDPEHGLAYEFLAESPGEGKTPVLTGHRDGVITINLAEADDAEREKRRLQLGEDYRTLLGHFRHEIGHYYWDRLIARSPAIERFRECFGDERDAYDQALDRHYRQGPVKDWQENFISAYASSHPWEDWAETWAHYLHITDTLETATACGLSLAPPQVAQPAGDADPRARPGNSFERLIERWYPLTLVLNNLNRGLGLPDGYPFVLSDAVIDKLRFVHQTVCAIDRQPPAPVNGPGRAYAPQHVD
ncbi:MAG: putative zinc-binding metallopeptidase [Candidatus Accumulibacter sp. UW20]|jgi:hypothetical protein